MTAMNLSALTFQSDHPARLAEFYRREIGVPLELNRHGTVKEHYEGLLNGVHIAVLRAGARLGGPIVPVFRVESLDASVTGLRTRGVDVALKPLALGEGKRVAAFADPDGNVFRLIEISSEQGPERRSQLEVMR
jgi:predicted enzyme related to lactoylglutathione lyase